MFVYSCVFLELLVCCHMAVTYQCLLSYHIANGCKPMCMYACAHIGITNCSALYGILTCLLSCYGTMLTHWNMQTHGCGSEDRYLHVEWHACVCVCVSTCADIHIHTHIYIHTHSYIHTYIHTHAHRHAYIHIHAYIHTKKCTQKTAGASSLVFKYISVYVVYVCV